LSEFLKAIVLGVVQGLTEFMPVSSSAHLIIVPWLFDWDTPALNSLWFDVALHLGTLAAVIIYFAQDLIGLVRAGLSSIVERRIEPFFERKLAWMISIATIPAGIAGLLVEDSVESIFHTPGVDVAPQVMLMIAFMLAALGGALFLAERLARHIVPLEKISWRQAIAIGVAQMLALFPGVSRSGSTITAGLALGLRREAAARFSFLLSTPITFGAGVKSLLSIAQDIQAGTLGQADLALFAAGVAAAGISGYLCIHFLLRFLRRYSTGVFIYYRWALAILIVVVVFVRG
jgi:undecaprenyl-diphosphatase